MSQIATELSTVPTVNVSHKVRDHKGRVKNVKSLTHAYQSVVVPQTKVYSTIASDSTPPSNLFRNSGAVWRTTLEAGVVPHIKSLVLRFKISEGSSSSMKLAATPYWFDRIVVKQHGGSNAILQTFYADTLFANMGMLQAGQKDSILHQSNINPKNWWARGDNESVPASASGLYYYLPLVGAFWDNFVAGLPFGNSSGNNLVFEFHPKSDIRISGSGTVDCDSLSFLIEHEDKPSHAQVEEANLAQNAIFSANFLDSHPVHDFSKTLTAGNKATINLESLTGDIAYLVFCVRATSPSNTDNANQKYLAINGEVDIEDPASQSVYGKGVAIRTEEQLRDLIFPQHSDSGLNKWRAIYFVPFCKSMKASMMGQKHGYLTLNGENFRLAITPGNAGTQSVCTVNLSNAANDGGEYTLALGGEQSDSLAYNAATGTMESALDSFRQLREAKDGPITTSVSGTAETDFTVTYSPAQAVDDSFNVRVNAYSLADGGVAEAPASSITTQGKAGWTTGTYQVDIFAMVHKKVVSHQGKLVVSDY